MASASPETPALPRPKASAGTLFTIAGILIVLGYSWRSCWYATRLTDAEIESRLASGASANEMQKALCQIKDRLDAGDAQAAVWLPRVLELAGHEQSQIRSTVAWLLASAGTDANPVLVAMLDDAAPTVRYNAACSLAAHGDPAGRKTLVQMLLPYPLPSPADGEVRMPRGSGEPVRVGQILMRLQGGSGEGLDVVAPLDGRISKRNRRHGEKAARDEILLEIEPAIGQIENALYALGRVGAAEDLPVLREIASGSRDLRPETLSIAREVIRAIEARR